jgi:hypothetical protein
VAERRVKEARLAPAKRTGRATAPNALLVGDALEEWYKHDVEPRYRVTKNVRVYINRAVSAFGTLRLQELEHDELNGALRARLREDNPCRREPSRRNLRWYSND